MLPILSTTQAYVCMVLAAAPPEGLHGRAILRVGGPEIKPGTIYATLLRLEGKGLLESTTFATPQGERGPPRRVFRLTGDGRRALEAWQRRAQQGWVLPT